MGVKYVSILIPIWKAVLLNSALICDFFRVVWTGYHLQLCDAFEYVATCSITFLALNFSHAFHLSRSELRFCHWNPVIYISSCQDYPTAMIQIRPQISRKKIFSPDFLFLDLSESCIILQIFLPGSALHYWDFYPSVFCVKSFLLCIGLNARYCFWQE